jgi:hypothetical protein
VSDFSEVPARVRGAPDSGRNGLPDETLINLEVVDASGLIIIKTVWATTPDLRAGHRLTRIENLTGQAALETRLVELAGGFFRRKPAAPAPPQIRLAAPTDQVRGLRAHG